ncbi:MAG: hypothetical protein KF775_17245 [Cyclobacteriaceae bacterium]|nr:hypothetical protein [Cyclobacteriaceae bacterium]
MIKISDAEMEDFFELCTERTFRSKEFLSEQGSAANEIFFITKGLTRSLISNLPRVTPDRLMMKIKKNLASQRTQRK